ncbi:N-acetylglucosamine-6-phosphate deacetylase [Dysosmobacter sp.]|uniref:N-acetylglucosamine-6-phosphate deacetylase n=1 Tax=Dysosmobacter sp. TaxID=2591382 RepID=UPI002A850C01|nr:N-acetylglucosamine-6-phosphate deacetylase [Dysosmobacter sp.]MDY3280835.1 N-acetylglucosamine-6-phosphate deacetylase [Dysosmobacter sp.]
MLIKNASVFVGRSFQKADLRFEGDTITAIGHLDGPADLDAEGCCLIPGLVDVHTHGAVGEDFSDANAAGLQPMADYYAAHGVTSFLATTMTLKEEVLTPAMHTLRDYKRTGGAKCAGIHLEGPFLSYAKRGAQAAENLHLPDAALFDRLNEASGGQVKMVTVACEEEGAMDFITHVSRYATVSLGHTSCTYDQAMEAFAHGASHATHLFNGMEGLHHRKPGIIAAAMDAGASVELICDGLHIHPAVIRLVHKLYGDKLNLISDSLRCAGMPDGDYMLGGQPITMKNGKATLTGTDTLAGSSISLLDAVRNVVSFGLPLADAVYAASTAPALAVGLTDVGTLQTGKKADLLVLDRDLALKAVFVDGRRQA